MTAKLAIEGGSPVRTSPLPAWPRCTEEDVQAAEAVLRSGRLNYWTGEEGTLFEKEFAEFVGQRYAIALANGTVALEAALFALGIGTGDEVIVPSRTFIASASCAVMRGATPVVVDIDRNSQNLSVETIRRAVTPRTRAIVAVHLAGWPCDMDEIVSFARQHRLKVIEDCAQSTGAYYKHRQTGSLADVGAFSFCQDKIMTTCGEGGMLTTSDPVIYEKAWSYKDHGKNRLLARADAPSNAFRWLHDSFGTNWRMTEVQSAVGRSQLRRLRGEVATRRRNAEQLISRMSQIPALRVPVPPPEIEHSYYKFYAFLRPEMLDKGWSRSRVIGAINAEGIPCYSGSCSEIYLEKAFDQIRPATRHPIARELGETSLMFLVHPTLSESDMMDAATAIEKVMTVAALREPLAQIA